VLFSGIDGAGHLFPLLPLARALRRAGHSVAFMAPSPASTMLAAEGFPLLAAGPSINEVGAATVSRHPELLELPPERAIERAIVIVADVRVELTTANALAAARAWRPDMIVSEHSDFVGPLVAALTGTRRATLGWGPGPTADVLALASDRVAKHYRAHGLKPPRRGGLYEQVYLDTCPPALQSPGFPRPPHLRPLRPEPYTTERQQWSPPDFAQRADRPLVLLTMGTVFNDATVLATALDGLAQLDVNVVLTTGPSDNAHRISVDPARVRIEQFAPLGLVLGHCDLVVAHGGAGTTIAALAHGIPLVMIPQGADQFINTARVASAGAGLPVSPSRRTAETIRDAAALVLRKRSYASNAKWIAAQIAIMPSAAHVASQLVASVQEHNPSGHARVAA
jgi:UDP:flavonoid glycosyltransferase YjiC (YdhE family)